MNICGQTSGICSGLRSGTLRDTDTKDSSGASGAGGALPENDQAQPDPEEFMALVSTRMPFGKYEGRLLIDLPEPYVVWFANHGFPEGRLGRLLRTVHEVKINGLEYLFEPLREKGHRT